MTKVLVTGATGFVGSHICRQLLSRGYVVFATYRASSEFKLVEDIKDKITWHQCDLTETQKLEEIVTEVDTIIHSAAVVSFQPGDQELMHKVNVLATGELVDLALNNKIEKFVHLSSIAALGRASRKENIDESLDWVQSPQNTMYSISKNLGEREVWRSHAEGLNMIILNPSLIIGVGDYSKGTAAVIPKMAKGNSFYPLGSTGFVDVRDVARFAIAALESDISGERFIISGENQSYKYYLDLIATELNVKKPHRPVTKLLQALLWRLDWLKSTLFRSDRLVTKETLLASSSVNSFSNQKSRQLSSKPYISLEKSVGDLVKAYKKGAKHNV